MVFYGILLKKNVIKHLLYDAFYLKIRYLFFNLHKG